MYTLSSSPSNTPLTSITHPHPHIHLLHPYTPSYISYTPSHAPPLHTPSSHTPHTHTTLTHTHHTYPYTPLIHTLPSHKYVTSLTFIIPHASHPHASHPHTPLTHYMYRYTNTLLKRVAAGGICFSKSRKCFISRSSLAFKAEEFTDMEGVYMCAHI